MRPPFMTVPVPPEHRQFLDGAASSVRAGCPHADHAPVLVICVQHPQTVRCHPCSLRHVATHTFADEFGCDVCGEHIDGEDRDTMHTALLHRAVVDRTVTLGRGRTTHVAAAFLIGWGTCWSCHIDAQWPAVAS
jgi:hypothetical protein